MTGRAAVSGIVLAGGRSRRFGRDKLAERIGDRTLLELAIEAVRSVAADVVVVAAPAAAPDVPPGVELVHDDAAFEGPLAGLIAGLTAVREPLVVVVGGDMPTLSPAVLDLLVRTLEVATADACALHSFGRLQPLPMALRTGAATALVRQLVAERERRLGAVLDRLSVRTLGDGEWRALDPEARTLRDIDEPADLEGLP
ncbi:MAG TPA: molybdenum cofactor guanylyltransferase [Clostridia bacterium]|nr:molybdenum cofactor guanylyltransferase [Clostridia bacterium]